MTLDLPPTRAAALDQLSRFAPRAGSDYANNRNFDLGRGNHIHVSQLSPYLRCRLITEEEVLKTVLEQHSYKSAEKYVQEVFWRTYWKGWLELRPAVWDMYQSELTQAWNAVQTQSGLRDRWEAACFGATDIDCFNIWSQELVSTGYLHNHARIWFASIWIFTLKLPWVLGADFFLRHLLDGDPASNTLGWRWVAGVQTQGKTYLATARNISKFTDGRVHPKWQLASQAEPLVARPAPSAGVLPDLYKVDPDKRTGFLLHEEDLSPNFAPAGLTKAALAVLSPQTRFGPLETAQHVTSFRQNALEDARTRLVAERAGVTDVTCATDILDWARREQLEQIVTAYAPVGPVARVLSQISKTTDALRLCQRMRAYDRMTWPHATRGFFPFKKQLPDFISKMGTLPLL